MCGLGALAALSLLACELAPLLSIPAALIALGQGLRQARRHLRQPSRQLVLAAGAPPLLDGEPVAGAHLHWRGTLAFLTLRDARGATVRLVGWPDTLDAAGRRELRLAWAVQGGARAGRSMAP